MSLTVLLLDPESKYEPSVLYRANITHNLTDMAQEAGLYKPLWRPDEINKNYANEIQEDVERGLNELLNNPEYFKRFNSSNGWGIYKHFVPFVENYLEAIKNYPEAEIYIIR
jgi:hypothetical protein